MKKQTKTATRVSISKINANLLQAAIDRANKEFLWKLSEALYGDSKVKTNLSWRERLVLKIKYKWMRLRIRLAESIGGDDLHDGCY